MRKIGEVPLRKRVEDYFRRNPGEWLSHEDGAIKFNCSRTQFRDALEALRASGRIEFETISVVRLRPGFVVPAQA